MNLHGSSAASRCDALAGITSQSHGPMTFSVYSTVNRSRPSRTCTVETNGARWSLIS
jgi:hypothetical protein